MTHRISLIHGDGIGPEIVDATVSVINSLGIDIEWVEVKAGSTCMKETGTPLPEETVKAFDETGVLLKGPLETPIGSGFRSINVKLRGDFDLFANVRPIRSIPGIETPFKNVDMVLVRENTEGAYIGVEHTVPPQKNRHPEAAESLAIITRAGSERVARFAFEHAQKVGRKKVTIVHKANILKETCGLFLRTCQEVAKDYPEIECDAKIVDNMCMQMVMQPQEYDMIVTTNLFGDILSDLGAGLIGGLGLAAGANIGLKHAMFEAVHGTAPDIAGKGIANPTALMFSSVLMLEHIGEIEASKRMYKAILETIADGKNLTGDLGGNGTTQTYTQALIQHIENQ